MTEYELEFIRWANDNSTSLELEPALRKVFFIGVEFEREKCAEICYEASDAAAEIGHERFARYSAEMGRKIRMRY